MLLYMNDFKHIFPQCRQLWVRLWQRLKIVTSFYDRPLASKRTNYQVYFPFQLATRNSSQQRIRQQKTERSGHPFFSIRIFTWRNAPISSWPSKTNGSGSSLKTLSWTEPHQSKIKTEMHLLICLYASEFLYLGNDLNWNWNIKSNHHSQVKLGQIPTLVAQTNMSI